MDVKTLVDALVAKDNARGRSQQKAIGVSQLGSCRRAVWHTLQGHEGNNPTDNLAAIMGTAIHNTIEQAFENSGALIEHRVEIEGYPPATIDYFDPTTGEVVDWKTIKLSGIPYFISQQKIWQVQCYGYLMMKAGYDVKTVTLVGIPRDGGSADIIVRSFAFDPSVAEEAFGWLADVESRTEAPAPERDATSWCAKYCKFYGDLCGGIPKDISGEAITDDVAAEAAERYVAISSEIKKLEAEKDAARAALEGVTGITMSGVKVAWSEVKGRETPDTDEIKKLLGTVPVKLGMPTMRLTVK